MACYREPLIYLDVLPGNRNLDSQSVMLLLPLPHACKARLGRTWKAAQVVTGDFSSLNADKLSLSVGDRATLESPRRRAACQI